MDAVANAVITVEQVDENEENIRVINIREPYMIEILWKFICTLNSP